MFASSFLNQIRPVGWNDLIENWIAPSSINLNILQIKLDSSKLPSFLFDYQTQIN